MTDFRVDRRNFLKLGVTGALALVAPQLARAEGYAFTSELPIPPLREGRIENGRWLLELSVRHGERQFLPGYVTPTLGYDQDYLGPTLKVRSGDKLSIRVENRINEPTTVHWHGMIIPARMDGGPHQTIHPGKQWVSEYEVIQPAATLFYHSHAHGETGQQVYRGLGGMMIIEDDLSTQPGLPSEYGVDDIPVILQDRDFDQQGRFEYVRMMPEKMIGKHGATLLVNGQPMPVLTAKRTLLRLRLLNASNARFYQLAFSDRRPFQVIGSDGGLLSQAVTTNTIMLAPAERYEILVDLSDRRPVMLRSFKGVGNAGHGPMRMMGMDRSFDVMLIDPRGAGQSGPAPALALPQIADLTRQPTANIRELEMQMGAMGGGMMDQRNRPGHMMRPGMMMGMMDTPQRGHQTLSSGMMRINGEAFSMHRVDFAMRKNTIETWRIRNASPMVHPFHIHNTQFQIVRRDHRGLMPWEYGRKDTVVVYPNETVDVLVPTGPYSDPDVPYMYHCHILEHEDGGMMGQFTVV